MIIEDILAVSNPDASRILDPDMLRKSHARPEPGLFDETISKLDEITCSSSIEKGFQTR